ncbi:Rv3654c family TadE-like protein [uncultured Cellulomonas sp.]|uniref:Rv3654c family TadE-like protein n=1 Tax=uncultured Cellulomonas sp. TaxID=189682 RepID=UPI0026363CCB|nr:Rv3654c family TadE-like protein [uncultured Cellulomonas sp.]
MTRRRPGHGDERGSGTVLVLGLVAVALVLLVGVAALAGAERARSAAQSAADLAALAAAARLADPGGTGAAACAVAREVAGRNGARLTGCRPGADGAVVVSTARSAGSPGTATARARAGPADLRPGGAGAGRDR